MRSCRLSFSAWFVGLVLLLPLAERLRADALDPLRTAIGAWTMGKEDWAFVRKTRTLDGDGNVKDERVEGYDPSQPDDNRWRLVEVNGKPPGEEDLARERKKNSKAKRYGSSPPSELLDLDRAEVRKENAQSVTYEVPMKRVAAGLVQTSTLVILITVDRSTHAVERLTARLRGPMRIALGIAKITDVDLNLSFDPEEEKKASSGQAAPMGGTARATLSTFGTRMEYEWSDFRIVRAYSKSPGL